MQSPEGLYMLDCALTVVESAPRQRDQAAPSYRFYVPIPPGWTDEQLMQAMIEQAGLDFDHVLNFGLDLRRGTACNAPTCDLFFNLLQLAAPIMVPQCSTSWARPHSTRSCSPRADSLFVTLPQV